MPKIIIDPAHTGDDLLKTGTPPFKIWQPLGTSIVLGYSRKPEEDIRFNHLYEYPIPIYRRSGGGGTVLLSPESLCVALRLQRIPDKGIRDHLLMGSEYLNQILILESGAPLSVRDLGDICIGDKKLFGCSLRMKPNFVLYSGILMVNNCIPLINIYLQEPKRQPPYRGKRKHAEFLTHLNSIKNNCSHEALIHSFIKITKSKKLINGNIYF